MRSLNSDFHITEKHNYIKLCETVHTNPVYCCLLPYQAKYTSSSDVRCSQTQSLDRSASLACQLRKKQKHVYNFLDIFGHCQTMLENVRHCGTFLDIAGYF